MAIREADAIRTFALGPDGTVRVRRYQDTPTGQAIHPSIPLANVAIQAFAASDQYIATQVAPEVTVDFETGNYYIFDPAQWLLVPNALRARKTRPARIEFRVSTDAYAVKGYALAGEIAKEDLSNADRAIRLRENTTLLVTEALLRGLEDRVGSALTSGTNLGSYVVLSGTAKWSDYVNSDPLENIRIGRKFVEDRTGLSPNVAILDKDTFSVLQRHPDLLDLYKYTQGGLLPQDAIANALQVDKVLIGRARKNVAKEGQPASLTNIWGNVCLLAYIDPRVVSLEAKAPILRFVWRPEGFPAPLQVLTYDDPDPGVGIEVVQVQYWSDEKIVAKDLIYGILSTI
jgi:hypothetical protein